MYLFILLIGSVLFPQACTLKCWESEHPTLAVKTEKTCSAEFTRCGFLRLVTFMGNSKLSESFLGSCFKADDCFAGSLNFGLYRSVTTFKCCDSDLCNTEPAPAPPKTNPNGKKCYRCDGRDACNGTVNCDGDEDFCASTSLNSNTIKGCATKSMCSMTLPRSKGYPEVLCCEGDFCNGSSGTRASLLLLVTTLISLFFLTNDN